MATFSNTLCNNTLVKNKIKIIFNYIYIYQKVWIYFKPWEHQFKKAPLLLPPTLLQSPQGHLVISPYLLPPPCPPTPGEGYCLWGWNGSRNERLHYAYHDRLSQHQWMWHGTTYFTFLLTQTRAHARVHTNTHRFNSMTVFGTVLYSKRPVVGSGPSHSVISQRSASVSCCGSSALMRGGHGGRREEGRSDEEETRKRTGGEEVGGKTELGGGLGKRRKDNGEGENGKGIRTGAAGCSSRCGPGGWAAWAQAAAPQPSMGGCVGSHHDSSGSLNENSDGTGGKLARPCRADHRMRVSGGGFCLCACGGCPLCWMRPAVVSACCPAFWGSPSTSPTAASIHRSCSQSRGQTPQLPPLGQRFQVDGLAGRCYRTQRGVTFASLLAASPFVLWPKLTGYVASSVSRLASPHLTPPPPPQIWVTDGGCGNVLEWHGLIVIASMAVCLCRERPTTSYCNGARGLSRQLRVCFIVLFVIFFFNPPRC